MSKTIDFEKSDRTKRYIALVVIIIIFGALAVSVGLSLYEHTANSKQNTKAPSGYTWYVVTRGETLDTVGERFGISSTALARLNNLTGSSAASLRLNEALLVPDTCNNSILNTSLATPLSGAIPQNVTSGKKYVVIRFDDSSQDQWTNALPVLLRYKFNAFFAVIAGRVLNMSICGLSWDMQEMNWQEVQWLASNGFYISDHTMTHPDLGTLSYANLQYQIVYSKTVFQNHNITVNSLTLPYDDARTNATVKNFTLSNGLQYIYPVDSSQGGIINYNYSNINLQWSSIDALHNQSLANFEQIVNQASGPLIVGLVFHHVSDHAVNTGYYVNNTNFQQDIAYLSQNGYAVIVPSNLPGYQNP